jgi:hypothetical protein
VTIQVTRIVQPPTDVAAPEIILDYRRFDGSALLGKATSLTSGAPTNQWDATLRRYTRRGLVSSSAVTDRIQEWIEPRAIVDPRYPPSGLVLRIRNTMHMLVTGFVAPVWAGASYSRASWGFRAQPGNLNSLNQNQTPFIGFRLDLLGGTAVLDPTWKTDFVNWDKSVRRSVDTNLNSGAVRDFMVELNGVDQTIRWYVDNQLVDSYKPASGDVGGQNLTPAEWTICSEVSASSGGVPTPTMQFSFHCGVGPLTTCTYHDA